MKTLGMLLLLSLSGAVIGGFADDGQYVPSVFIGDGSSTTAVGAIESISAITEELPGKLEFTCNDGERRFVLIESAKQSLACFIQIDAMRVQVAVGGYLVDDERLDLTATLQKIKKYDEAANSTDSRASIFLNASEEVSGERLVDLLDSMVGIREIWRIEVHQALNGTTCTIPDPCFSKGKAKTNPIRRQAERLPYKIDLEN